MNNHPIDKDPTQKTNNESIHKTNSDPTQKIDIIIVSTNHKSQEEFWQKRLEELRGFLYPTNTLAVAITEDWPAGAGNGLGTLYAYKKGREKILNLYNQDIIELQKNGTSVALYHTAGSGKRLTPLTASEMNNKSAIKLPGYIGNTKHQLTILEAVIRQTLELTRKQQGRLSVFWGDQVFIPVKPIEPNPQEHVSIYCKVVPFPSERDWMRQGLKNYGVISITETKNDTHNNDTNNINSTKQVPQSLSSSSPSTSSLLEKVDYATLESFSAANHSQTLGISLGSFSLSPQMTCALMREFAPELEKKLGKLDTDPHFWMPLTLDRESYLTLMINKEPNDQEARKKFEQLYDRMSQFKEKLPPGDVFGVIDIGKNAYWWDYGSTRHYFKNILKLTDQDSEGRALRLFYQLDPLRQSAGNNRVIRDDQSCLVNCQIKSGRIQNSVLIGVEAEFVDVTDCVIINSKLGSITANQGLFYQVTDLSELKMAPGTIRADTTLPGNNGLVPMYSHQERCGKIDWSSLLPNNSFTFEELAEKISLQL